MKGNISNKIKFVLLVFCTCFVANLASAKSSVEKPNLKEISTTLDKKLSCETVWGYGPGPCLHLYSICEVTTIDNSGMATVTGYNVLILSESNYHGTSTICPPAGSWYC